MRKLILFLLILSIFFGTAACDLSDANGSVSFYYPKNPEIPTTDTDTFYAVENRESFGRSSDLRHLLSLYLQGPLSGSMINPFPENTRLVSTEFRGDHLYLRLSHEFAQLTGVELTVACACISLTCFDLTEAEQVTVLTLSPENVPGPEVTMTRRDLTLTDPVSQETTSP